MWWYVLAAVLAILVWYIALYSREKMPGIPGPPRWPLLGNVLQISPHQILTWANSYGGVYKVWVFEEEMVVVTGLEAITEACHRRAADFDGRPARFRNRIISINYSDLCFTKGCERVWWTRHFVDRSMTEHMGGVRHVEHITLAVLRGLVKKLGSMGNETAFNPVPLLTDTSLQILHVLMFREHLDSGSKELATLRRINALLVEALAFDSRGVLLDRFPWTRFLPGGQHTYAACHQALQLYNELYEKWKNLCHSNDSDVGGVVRHLIKLMGEDNPVELKDDNIVALIENLMVAGNMNISSLMASLLNIMVHYPAVQAQIQEEADRIVGPTRQVNTSDERDMTYTQAVVLELLRFAHPAPFGIQRRSVNNSSLCGFPVPRGTNILLNLWGQHHSPTIWKEPYRFRPERFLDQDGELLPMSHPCRRNLIPFGVGSRMCVGAKLGLQHLFLMTATILHNFRIRPADTELSQPSCDPRSMSLGIVMMPQDYCIRVTQRMDTALPSSSSSSGVVDSTS